MDHGGRAIRKRDWLKSGEEVGYTSGSVSYSVKVALDYLYLVSIGCRTNNSIMTVKCQNVVKCELYLYSRCQMC